MARLWALPRRILRPGVPRRLSLGGPTLGPCLQRRGLVVLGIETSCDDTCVAVLTTEGDGIYPPFRILSGRKVTCANKHHRGVHPVEAVESHTKNLPEETKLALRKSLGPIPLARPPDLVAVTRGPGMKPCLNVGISFAKALALSWGVPLVGVHHMQAHALTPQLEAAIQLPGTQYNAHEPQYPFLTLLVSGGHTMLVYTKSAIEHRVLASTQRGIVNPDKKGSATAIGEMLDKCARAILPKHFIPASETVVYAKEMETYCESRVHKMGFSPYQAPQTSEVYQSKDSSWSIPPPLRQSQEMKYNFTGLGGKVRAIMDERPDMPEEERAELAYTTMRLAFEHIISRVIMALENDEELLANPPRDLVMSGGVANSRLLGRIARAMLKARGFDNVTLVVPSAQYCTDNAAMIAWAGLKMYEAGWTTDKSFLPQGEWPIEEIITGVDCWIQKPLAASRKPTSNAAAPPQDKLQLPDNSAHKDPPLPSTASSSAEPNAPTAPNAGVADRHKPDAKSVPPTDGEVAKSKSKSQDNEPSAKHDPGRPSSQDGQHAPDSEQADSQQETTARATPSPPGRSPPAPPTKRAKAKEQPPRGESDAEEPDDPMGPLREAEEQLLRPSVRRVAGGLTNPPKTSRRAVATHAVDGRLSKIGSDTRPADRELRLMRNLFWERAMRSMPAEMIVDTSALDRAAEEARKTAGEAPRGPRQTGEAVGSGPAGKPQLAKSGKPKARPGTVPTGERRVVSDGPRRPPWRSGKAGREGERHVRELDGEEKRQVVRLLPPAPPPADKEGPLRAGVSVLKRWIGL